LQGLALPDALVEIQQASGFGSELRVTGKNPTTVKRVAPVRLRDGFVARRLGSATTKRSGDSNEIEPVILVGY
jgi:hypothetical protein